MLVLNSHCFPQLHSVCVCVCSTACVCVCGRDSFTSASASHISHSLAHRPHSPHLKTTNQELISCIINWPACWIFYRSWTGSVGAGAEIDGVSGLDSVFFRGGGSWSWGIFLRRGEKRGGWELWDRGMTKLWACCESLMILWWLLRVTTQEPPVEKGRVRTPTWSVKAAAPFIRKSLMIPM